jgi:hypothetical protein
VDAQHPLTASTSWFGLRISGVRWCRGTNRGGPKALAIAVEIENRTDAWLPVRDQDIELFGPDARRIARSLPPIGSECPAEGLGVLRPRETKRGWLYFAPNSASTRGLSLSARLREPHGFDDARLELGLPDVKSSAPKLDAAPPLPVRAPADAGIAPPVESPFYRVTVTAAKLCNGGRALPDGRVLVGVEVLLENFARVELEPSYTAVLRDASGAEHESTIVEQQGCEPKARVGATVKPGDRYKSWLWAFPIPAAAGGLILRYRVRGSALHAWEEVEIPVGDAPPP